VVDFEKKPERDEDVDFGQPFDQYSMAPTAGAPHVPNPTESYPFPGYPDEVQPTQAYPTAYGETAQAEAPAYPVYPGHYPAPQYPASQYPASQYPAPQYPPVQYPVGSPPPYYGGQAPAQSYHQSVPSYYAYGAGYPASAADAPFGRDPMTGEPLSDKSKVTAGVLQIFLGGFGAGRFYIGSNGVAVAQLLLLVLGWLTAILGVGVLILMGLGVWVIVDGIMMLVGNVRDSSGRRLRN
jgi:TM2 domain-containing membrane protein YozV